MSIALEMLFRSSSYGNFRQVHYLIPPSLSIDVKACPSSKTHTSTIYQSANHLVLLCHLHVHVDDSNEFMMLLAKEGTYEFASVWIKSEKLFLMGTDQVEMKSLWTEKHKHCLTWDQMGNITVSAHIHTCTYMDVLVLAVCLQYGLLMTECVTISVDKRGKIIFSM